jgi:L-threonylcarbamoyladenylate synthase
VEEPNLAPPFFDILLHRFRLIYLLRIMERGTDIKKAASILRNGGLVAFPTETVYGLGADGLNPLAVARIFEVKQRPSFDPLILHVGSPEDTHNLFKNPGDIRINLLISKFWPGPLTIVAEKQHTVPDIVTSGMQTVAVRMPSNILALELIREAGIPVAAPSANLFGKLSPTMPQHVQKQLKGVDYLLDGGRTEIGVESTIISFTGEAVRLLRPGAITFEQLQKIIPEIEWATSENEINIEAPGQLKSHYSPEKPLFIFDKLLPRIKPGSGIIYFSPPDVVAENAEETLILSESGDMIEAAARLFSALHDMENNPFVRRIFIEQTEEKGIGAAIMDRVKKAAYRHR